MPPRGELGIYIIHSLNATERHVVNSVLSKHACRKKRRICVAEKAHAALRSANMRNGLKSKLCKRTNHTAQHNFKPIILGCQEQGRAKTLEFGSHIL